MQPQQTSLGAGRKVSLLAFQELSENPTENLQIATGNLQNLTEDLPPGPQTAYGNRSSSGSVNSCNSESLLTNVLSSLPVGGTMQPQTSALSDLVCAMASSERPNVPASTSLTSHQTSSTIIVTEITPPVIGMTFSCYEDAREFYDAYSMRVGFGTKVKSSSFDRKTNEKNLVLLTCCKQGYKNESNIVCYRRPNVRVGCNAHLKIKLNDDKQWKVISVELEHNHECSPSKSRRFRSHKHMESGSKRRLELNCNSGVSLPKSYWTFVREAGGYEHVPFDQRDARNHIDKYRRLQLKEGDAETMHKYFQRYDVLHPYALQILEEGALSETKYKIVMDGLLDLKRKVLNADGGHEASDIKESQTPFNNGAESMQSEYVKLKNPLQATKIGRPKGRLISSSEKNVKSKITKLLNQMATKRSVGDLKEADLKGKKVFVRVDLNVPLDDNLNITDDTRVRAAIPTIKYLMGNGAKVILCSHLGRPKGVTPKYSLKPLVPRLSELLGVKVEMANDCIGEEVEKLVAALPEGGVLLLENVRFYKEEEKNDPEFAKKLASLADLYVNDAFGTAHRAHASTEGVTKYLKPAVAGFLMQKELDYLVGAVSNPKKPFAAIVGGSKVSSKIGVIESLLEKVDILLLGGGMIFTFYKAQGKAVGSSLVEEDKLTLATSLMEKAKAKGVSLLLPTDVVIADKFAPDANSEIVAASSIPDGWMGLDIGPDSIKTFGVALDTTQTVIWNGPMGVFEFDKFAAGTTAIAKKLADLSGKGVTTIIGGGDSVAAVEKAGLADKMSHISTGGGASLELLEGKPLPGVLALDEA